MEKKFLRGLSTVGHIEDIVVDKNQQGKKLGLRIIQALTGISEGLGAYKTILNCNDDNIRKPIRSKAEVPFIDNFFTAFYEKCGFSKKENEMVWLSRLVLAVATNVVAGQVCIGRRFSNSSPSPTLNIHNVLDAHSKDYIYTRNVLPLFLQKSCFSDEGGR